MTSAVLIGLAAYFAGAAYCITRVCRRVDAAFVRGMHQVLRSRGGVGSEAADRRGPLVLSAVTAGVEHGGHPPHSAAAAPPAPKHLAGAALTPSSAASARPPLVRLGGAL